MRICDAAKHASVDLCPAICSRAALAPVRIKYSLRGDCVMFLSIILHIKDKEKVIIWTEALDTISCVKNSLYSCVYRQDVEDVYKLCLCVAPMPREKKMYRCLYSVFDLFCCCFYFGSLSICTSETDQMAGLLSDKNGETRTLLHHETLWLGPQCRWRLE